MSSLYYARDKFPHWTKFAKSNRQLARPLCQLPIAPDFYRDQLYVFNCKNSSHSQYSLLLKSAQASIRFLCHEIIESFSIGGIAALEDKAEVKVTGFWGLDVMQQVEVI